MATAAAHAHGTTIDVGTENTVAQVRTVTGPGARRDVIDVTNLLSTDKVKEIILGCIGYGQVTLGLDWTPADTSHKAITSALISGDAQACVITLPDGSSTMAFNAYVTGFSPTGDVSSQLKADVTLDVSGAVTYPS